MGILQELVWQELGLWMKRSGERDHEEDAAPSEREKTSLTSHLCSTTTPSIHLTPGSQQQGACVTYFQNTRPLESSVHNHILALLIFPALALPPTPTPSHSALHPKNLISVSSILYSLCVCTSFHPNSEGPEKRTHFCLLSSSGYPQQCFGS